MRGSVYVLLRHQPVPTGPTTLIGLTQAIFEKSIDSPPVLYYICFGAPTELNLSPGNNLYQQEEEGKPASQ